jgi:hypothetical protein
MNLGKLVAVAIMALSAVTAHGDTISYSFSGSLFNVSFTVPSILTTDTIIAASNLLTNNTPDLLSLEINPTSFVCGGIFFPFPTRPPAYFSISPTRVRATSFPRSSPHWEPTSLETKCSGLPRPPRGTQMFLNLPLWHCWGLASSVWPESHDVGGPDGTACYRSATSVLSLVGEKIDHPQSQTFAPHAIGGHQMDEHFLPFGGAESTGSFFTEYL